MQISGASIFRLCREQSGPRKEKEQGTPASVLILNMMCLDPGTPGLGRSLYLWLQAVVETGA